MDVVYAPILDLNNTRLRYGLRMIKEGYFQKFRELAFNYQGTDEPANLWGFTMIAPKEPGIEEEAEKTEWTACRKMSHTRKTGRTPNIVRRLQSVTLGPWRLLL